MPSGDAAPPAVRMRTRLSDAGAVAAVALVACLAAAPFTVGRGLQQSLFSALVLMTLAQYWNLLAGFAGLISVGQQAFVGLGAYGLYAAVLGLGMDPYLALPLAGLAAAAVALPAARLLFRLAGAYFAVGSWVVAEVCRLVLAQQAAVGGGTGTSLPRSAMTEAGLVRLAADALGMRPAAARDAVAYWAALALAVLTVAAIYGLLRSRQGLALAAIRDDERAAGSVGVDGVASRLAVYVAAAFGTGIVGGLVFLQGGRISPDAAFSLGDWTADVIFIVVIGGVGTIEGPLVGTLIFFVLQGTLARYGAWYLMSLGALAMLAMLWFPRGLWGSFAHRTGSAVFPVRRRLIFGTAQTVEGE